MRRYRLTRAFSLAWLLMPALALASAADGTIDADYRHVWDENVSWIDFGSAAGDVHVTDGELTGYAWGENVGWISLNCANTSTCGTVDYAVSNDGEGTLSGYGWGENVGWIQFDPAAGGVSVDDNGEFSGYAWGENVGWISFNCANTNTCGTVDYKVATDWRPVSVRSTSSSSTACSYTDLRSITCQTNEGESCDPATWASDYWACETDADCAGNEGLCPIANSQAVCVTGVCHCKSCTSPPHSVPFFSWWSLPLLLGGVAFAAWRLELLPQEH